MNLGLRQTELFKYADESCTWRNASFLVEDSFDSFDVCEAFHHDACQRCSEMYKRLVVMNLLDDHLHLYD